MIIFQCGCFCSPEWFKECMNFSVCDFIPESASKNICVWKPFSVFIYFQEVNPRMYACENISMCVYATEKAEECIRWKQKKKEKKEFVFLFQRVNPRMYACESLLVCLYISRKKTLECMRVKTFPCVCMLRRKPKNVCFESFLVFMFLFQRVNPRMYACERLTMRVFFVPESESKDVCAWKPFYVCVCYRESPRIYARECLVVCIFCSREWIQDCMHVCRRYPFSVCVSYREKAQKYMRVKVF